MTASCFGWLHLGVSNTTIQSSGNWELPGSRIMVQTKTPCGELRLRGKSTPSAPISANLEKAPKKDAKTPTIVVRSAANDSPHVPRRDQDTETGNKGRKRIEASHSKPPIRLAMRGAGTSRKFDLRRCPDTVTRRSHTDLHAGSVSVDSALPLDTSSLERWRQRRRRRLFWGPCMDG